MPTKVVNDIIKKLEKMETDLNAHLMESGGIKTQLHFNTWLTGVILVALLGQFVAKFFTH